MNDLTLYQSARPAMSNMDLLQYHSYGVVGNLIRRAWPKFWQKAGFYNHSAVVISFPDISRDRRWTAEAINHGLVLNPLSEVLKRYNGSCTWYSVKPGIEKVAIVEATEWIMSNLGKPYDYNDLIKNVTGPRLADLALLFCSETIMFGWHWAAVTTGLKVLKHLLYRINTHERRVEAQEFGLEDYYKMYPDQKPIAPRPNDMHKLNTYVSKGVRIL